MRAELDADAESIGSRMDALVPSIRQVLGAPPGDVTVSILRDLALTGAGGQVLASGEILLESGPVDQMELILAHELAHRFLNDEDVWHQLPGIVEEGLADVVAGTALPEFALGIEFTHRSALPASASAASARRAIRTTLAEEMYDGDLSRVRELRAIGFVIARKIGIDGLRALSERSRHRENDKIPADWLLERCGVGDAEEPGVWIRVLGEADRSGWSSFQLSLRAAGG